MDSRRVGILGGGQLGRMLVEAANRLNIQTVVLDAENAPAKQVNGLHAHVNGSFADAASIRRLAEECDIITPEIEHVDTDVLREVAEQGVPVALADGGASRRRVEVQPSWRTIKVIQDKYFQKEHLHSHNIQTAGSHPLESNTAAAVSAARLSYPFMLKARTHAYDGRGNYPVTSAEDVPLALQALGNRPLYAEEWVAFQSEIAVMVVKVQDEPSAEDVERWKESTIAYPAVETVHEDSICKLVYAPAPNLSPELADAAETLARRAVASFWGKGIFGVEMFLLKDSTLLVNEIAPRPHNSGHFSIEACPISQFDAHLRAILDLPFPLHTNASSGKTCPAIGLRSGATHAIMLNILGGRAASSHLAVAREALGVLGAHVHLYGKGDARPGRKMGHVTVVAETMARAEDRIGPLVKLADSNRHASKTTGSTPRRSQTLPVVGVTMGSMSDLSVLGPGLRLLDDLGIPWKVNITSAHRTPEWMSDYAKAAAKEGIKVIIAAAGGAAHLQGMLASYTKHLPVIGVPVKARTLDGMDSLLSVVQMPRGVPVATVGINNSTNAALLAARILGVSDADVRAQIQQYADDMERGVMEQNELLQRVGWRECLHRQQTQEMADAQQQRSGGA